MEATTSETAGSRTTRPLRGSLVVATMFLFMVLSSVHGSTRQAGMTTTTNGRRRGFFRVDMTPPSSLTTEVPLSQTKTVQQQVTTDAATLAMSFEKALIAVQRQNQEDRDIHVGHLLSACERLEQMIRKIGFWKGANDIAGNMAKIRNVYSKLPDEKRNSMPELLRYEMEAGIVRNNGNNNKILKESSAAMGLLWLGRSLNYQYDMFRHMLENQNGQPYESACYAYENSLKPHLSWPLQKACQTALRATARELRREKILAGIGGFSEDCFGFCEHQATTKDLQQVVRTMEPMICRWRQVFSEMGLGDI
eukprot:scaffold1157_cov122-Cylindrotheca_fusiformis.AAC.6